jgi:pimeloyl-ACP methyl ester carboxylesterase
MKEILHHQIIGYAPDKEWVVFIHGAGGNMLSWKYQIDAFKPFFNLLLLDLRDHGESKNLQPKSDNYDFTLVANDILKLLDHLNIEKAHFITLSLGSIIVQKIQALKPEIIDRLVMAGGVFKADWKIKLFVHSAKLLNYILPYRVMYDLFSWLILPRKNHQKARRIFRLQSKKLLPADYLKWVELYKEFFILLKDFFHREIDALSLVIMGDEDHVFLKSAKRFVEKQRNATIISLTKSGHICNIDQYEAFNRVVIEFLKGIQPSTKSA